MTWPKKAIETKGIIASVGPEETVGAKGYKIRRIRVIPEGESSPLEVEFFGRNIPEGIDKAMPGDKCRFSFLVSQHEWNGKTFTKLDGQYIEFAGSGNGAEVAAPNDADDEPMPF